PGFSLNLRPAALAAVITLALIPVTVQSAPQTQPGDNLESQFGSSITLFTTLAAINAAGYDEGMDSALNQKYHVRTQVRQELAKRNLTCLPDLQSFYKAHKKDSPAANLSQYISFALIAGGPPFFETPNGPLPPDVQELKDFAGLLARFYKEADIDSLSKRSQGAYAAAISEYQDP